MKNSPTYHYWWKPHYLLNEYVDWVQWIKEISSWKEWPTIAISACTHGWEHSWLEAIDYLTNTIWIQEHLFSWKLFFILSNPNAYLHSLRPLEEKEENMDTYDLNTKRMMESRFIDWNMNRCTLPWLITGQENLEYYEQNRARDLVWVLSSVDIQLDIHSFTKPWGNSMLIISRNNYNQFKNVFNLQDQYVGIPDVQVGKPLISLTEHFWWVWIGMETWCEFNQEWWKSGVDNVIRLLSHQWMVDIRNFESDLLDRKPKKIFHVNDKIVIWNDTQKFNAAKDHSHWEEVMKWSLIATDWAKEYIAKENTAIILPWSPKTFKANEEYCYLWVIEK